MTKPSTEPTPIIQARGLCRTFPGPVEVLKDVSLTVKRGELIGIVGPSGSGKSTLLAILGTLDQPTSGTLSICGQETSELDDAGLSELRSSSLGFVFQQFHLMDRRSAAENVADGLLYRGVPRAERLTLARDALDRVGLSHRADAACATMSGGERQRTAIARALISSPELILADEPTGNLDSASGENILDLLRTLNQEGSTIVLITHDRDIASSLPRVVEIRDGVIVSDQEPAHAS
jgi:putative ABC transport system ATP-binding protein